MKTTTLNGRPERSTNEFPVYQCIKPRIPRRTPMQRYTPLQVIHRTGEQGITHGRLASRNWTFKRWTDAQRAEHIEDLVRRGRIKMVKSGRAVRLVSLCESWPFK